MSARNGDKSRFNRERKQKIARRKHTRELLRSKGTQVSGHHSPCAAKVGGGMNNPLPA